MVGVFEMVGTPKDKKEQIQEIQYKIDQISTENNGKKEQTMLEGNGKKEQTIKENVVLFFSFDVVNSTAYKTINYYGWAQVLNVLFKELRKEVKNKLESSEMWRVLGDEAIFIVKIRDEETLREYVNTVFKIMISTIFKLKKGEFFPVDDKFNLMKLQNVLSLKAAAWIAAVSDVGDIGDKDILQQEADNIFERYRSQEGYEIFEFLGNDIDIGFRISKQTQEGRMVLSYELAYLISQKTESLSYLHVITYKKLKGVWKDKLYPIIWYHDPRAFDKEIPFEDSFAFDACDDNELVGEYYDNQEKKNAVIHDIRMYSEPYYALNKVLKDRGLAEKITKLQQLIKDSAYDQARYIDMELMQIHCVAVCFQQKGEDIKILIAKRSNSRERYKGQWEFGCAKAVIDKSIAEKLKEEYKQDFDINIEPILDLKRNLQEPIPIALYYVKHNNDSENKRDKGIITLARITDDYDPTAFKGTEKHEKVRWITESEMSNLQELIEEAVPDFEMTLKEAFERIKQLCQKDEEK